MRLLKSNGKLNVVFLKKWREKSEKRLILFICMRSVPIFYFTFFVSQFFTRFIDPFMSIGLIIGDSLWEKCLLSNSIEKCFEWLLKQAQQWGLFVFVAIGTCRFNLIKGMHLYRYSLGDSKGNSLLHRFIFAYLLTLSTQYKESTFKQIIKGLKDMLSLKPVLIHSREN